MFVEMNVFMMDLLLVLLPYETGIFDCSNLG